MTEFRTFPRATFKWVQTWNDQDTRGSPNFQIGYADQSKLPAGYCVLGDVVSWWNSWYDAFTGKAMVMAKNSPTIARPCTDLLWIYSCNWVTPRDGLPPGPVNFYIGFRKDDPNFVGVGLISSRRHGTENMRRPPDPSHYYCVNKAYLDCAKASEFFPSNVSGSPGDDIYKPHLYNTFPSLDGNEMCGLFMVDPSLRPDAIFTTLDGPTMYHPMTTDEVWNRCATDQGVACENFVKISCSADDIKIGTGKQQCMTYCDKNSSWCDGVKSKFCADHPGDAFCDCINATSRPTYQHDIDTLQALIPGIDASVTFPCFTGLCKGKTDRLDTFVMTPIAKQMDTCPSLSVLRQQVDVSGTGNVTNVAMNAQQGGGTAPNTLDIHKATVVNSAPGNDTHVTTGGMFSSGEKIMGIPHNMFYIILVLLLVLVIIAAFVEDDDVSTTIT